MAIRSATRTRSSAASPSSTFLGLELGRHEIMQDGLSYLNWTGAEVQTIAGELAGVAKTCRGVNTEQAPRRSDGVACVIGEFEKREIHFKNSKMSGQDRVDNHTPKNSGEQGEGEAGTERVQIDLSAAKAPRRVRQLHAAAYRIPCHAAKLHWWDDPRYLPATVPMYHGTTMVPAVSFQTAFGPCALAADAGGAITPNGSRRPAAFPSEEST